MDKLDFYARDLNFTIKKRDKIISGLGVLLSFTTVSIVILSFFAFGRNFIYKKNPLILKSIVNSNNEMNTIEIKHNNLIQFPFRLKNKYGDTYTSKNLEFQITSVTYNNTSNNITHKNKLIMDSSCKNSLIEIPAFINNYNISEWSCINFESSQKLYKENFNFIGSENDNIFQYLKIELFCSSNKDKNPILSFKSTNNLKKNTLNDSLRFLNLEDINNNNNNYKSNNNIDSRDMTKFNDENNIYYQTGFNFSELKNSSLCDYESLISEINDKIYFEYLYPESYVAPHTSPDPFSINYYPISIELNVKNKKNLQTYLSYDMALDDIGWILEDKKNYRQFNTPYHRSDTSNLKSEDIQFNNSPLITLEIIALKDYILYTRIFMKMQEVAAQIGGLMNTFHVLFQILVYFITDNMKSVMINELFNIENKKKKIQLKKLKSEIFSSIPGSGLMMPNNINHINNKDPNINIHGCKQNSNIYGVSGQNAGHNVLSNRNINNQLVNHNQNPNPNTFNNLQSNLNGINNFNNNINININNNFNASNLHAVGIPNNSMNQSNLLNNFVNPMRSRLEKTKKQIISKNFGKKDTLIQIGCFENFKRRFCNRFYDKKIPNLKYYDIMCDYIDSRLDIIFYFKNLIATEKYKSFFLNDYEMRSFDYMAKLNVLDIEEEIELKKHDYYKFLDFFCDKLNHKGIKPYDEKMLNMMSDSILLEINNFNLAS